MRQQMPRKLLAAALLLLCCTAASDACMRKPATVDDAPLSDWSQWSDCSSSCGEGTQTRWRRLLIDNGGVISELKICVAEHGCKPSYKWSSWSDWSQCSTTCGTGSQSRNRSCLLQPGRAVASGAKLVAGRSSSGRDAAATVTDAYCVGMATEKRACDVQPCPTQPPVPQWSNWSEWSECSSSCDGGQQWRDRSCQLIGGGAAVRPAANGSCPGLSNESRACSESPCPTEPPKAQWQQWSTWSTCSSTCGAAGIRMRSRACRWPNAAAASGQPECDGEASQTQQCLPGVLCAVLPAWQQWSEWSGCSVTCGSGKSIRVRTRSCEEQSRSNEQSLNATQPPCRPPSPSEQQQQQQQRNCSLSACPPVHGQWSNWDEWSNCLMTCGYSQRVRIRYCDSPRPSNGGNNCSGESIGLSECLGGRCPVDGGWTKWKQCTECITQPLGACAKGEAKFCRSCSNPKPQFGGTACPSGVGAEWRECWNVPHCDNKIVQPPMSVAIVGFLNTSDVQAKWQRAPYGLAADSFLVAWQINGGIDITEKVIPTLPRSQWKELGEWYELWIRGHAPGSKLDFVIATRATIETEQRTLTSTPVTKTFVVSRVDGGWSEWGGFGPCSKTSSCHLPGRFTRVRQCNNPAPANGGVTCPGPASQSKVCYNTC